MEGKILDNRYDILEKIDAGGSSNVYRAVDRKTKNIVAVKVLKRGFSKNRDFVRRFETEIHAALTLDHNNIVHVLDAGNTEDSYYLVMEFIEGQTLKQMIVEKGALDLQQAVDITINVCSALTYAHGEGFVHRDIKPANILIQKDGRVKITDFGIARNVSDMEKASKKNLVVGSVQYIPPEQIKGEKTDRRTDVYALGISLYEMVTGTLPFEGETTTEMALKHLNERIPQPKRKNDRINEALNKIVLKATRKNKRLRYNSTEEFAADLKRCFDEPDGEYVKLEQERLQRMPSKAAQKAFKRRLTLSLIVVGIGVIITAAVLILLAVIGTRSNAQSTPPKPVEVPFFIGMTETEVVDMADEYGVQLTRLYDYSQEDPEGYAMLQSPEAGSTVQPNTAIEVTFSLGTEMVSIPDLIDRPLEEVRDLLSELGLTVGDIEYVASDQPAGYVISQDPEPDTQVPVEETVNLSVSKIIDLTRAVVPDFSGMTIDEVKAAFAELDFEKCFVYLEPGEDGGAHKQPGVVLNQTPHKNTEEEVTRPIYVWIGAYPVNFSTSQTFNVTIEQPDTLVRVTLSEADSPIEMVMMESKMDKGEKAINVELSSFEAKEKYVKVYVSDQLVEVSEVSSWGRKE